MSSFSVPDSAIPNNPPVEPTSVEWWYHDTESEPFQHSSDDPGVYAVCIGPFGTKQEAQRHQANIRVAQEFARYTIAVESAISLAMEELETDFGDDDSPTVTAWRILAEVVNGNWHEYCDPADNMQAIDEEVTAILIRNERTEAARAGGEA